MTSKPILAALTSLFVAIAMTDLYADSVYLKNSQVVKGIILSDDEKRIIIDIGCGKSNIPESSVDRVEKSSKEENDQLIKEWKVQYFDSGRWTPSAAVSLLSELKEIRNKKKDFAKIQVEKQKIRAKITGMEKELSELYDKYEELNNKLKTIPSNNVDAYNIIVADINLLGPKIKKLRDEMERNLELEESANAKISDYVTKINTFVSNFQERYEQLERQGFKQDEEYFYKKMREEAAKLGGYFKRDEVNFSGSRNEVIVYATLNGKVGAALVVDTGASMVVISQRIADKLGIDTKTIKRKITVKLADGSMAEATPIVLDSVKVGNSKVTNVFAAVTQRPVAPGIDGLLGMTFLNNFSIKIDTNSNKLVLEQLK